MSKERLGKVPDSIYFKENSGKKSHTGIDLHEPAEQAEEEAPKEKQARGRPQEHKEGWSKVTVVLLDKQIHWLDQLASTIRLNTKAAVSRAELIRAVIAAVEESGIDLSQLGNEKDIKNFLLEKLNT